ncbi:hypothetical protein GYMLUDRAFT_439911 [Collybiopsis luxurians FD-317 M1]|uniref:Uncharacterized protein n=1 Tax=Collybiopsis luxurians FD-317 M1 TaxID=944289 RepID=A0A0D0BYR4_9AGAR|nr:hypothetical protein GYMLUDRAFT_439911 [Collybiopsis luxurians FD-317 M1]
MRLRGCWGVGVLLRSILVVLPLWKLFVLSVSPAARHDVVPRLIPLPDPRHNRHQHASLAPYPIAIPGNP